MVQSEKILMFRSFRQFISISFKNMLHLNFWEILSVGIKVISNYKIHNLFLNKKY